MIVATVVYTIHNVQNMQYTETKFVLPYILVAANSSSKDRCLDNVLRRLSLSLRNKTNLEGGMLYRATAINHQSIETINLIKMLKT